MSGNINIVKKRKQIYLYNTNLVGNNEVDFLFEPEQNLDRVVVEGVAGGGTLGAGRGNTYFLNLHNQQLVLRHYCRGGMIAKLSYDAYIWLGLQKTRAYQEFTLLQKLHNLNLFVPDVYAARICRKGFFYSADLITVRLKQAKSLAERCLSANMSDNDWLKVGELIKKFHVNQVYHADLNAHNILFSEEQCYLIDFDKCQLRSEKKAAWKKDNIARLKRSLEKLRNNQYIQFTEHEWQLLLSAYQ